MIDVSSILLNTGIVKSQNSRNSRVVRIMNRFEKTIVINEESVAVDAIASLSGLSKSTVKKLMTLGAVWIKRKGKLARFRSHKKTLQAGTEVKVYYDEKNTEL